MLGLRTRVRLWVPTVAALMAACISYMWHGADAMNASPHTPPAPCSNPGGRVVHRPGETVIPFYSVNDIYWEHLSHVSDIIMSITQTHLCPHTMLHYACKETYGMCLAIGAWVL